MGRVIVEGPYPKDHPMKSGRYSINLGRLLDDGRGDLTEYEHQSPSKDSKKNKPKSAPKKR